MIFINEIYQNVNTKEQYRIIDIDNITDICFLYKLNSNKPVCEYVSYIIFLSDIKNNFYINVKDEFKKFIDENYLNEKYKQKRDEQWSIIQGSWVEYKEKILSITYKKNVFKEIAENKNVSESTIRRLFTKFFQYGMTKNALIYNYSNCGGKGKEKLLGDKKVGKPRMYDDTTNGINITDDIKDIFRTYIDKYYNTSKELNLSEVYNRILRDKFSNQIKEDNEIKYILYPKNKLPTYRQFYYWYKKNTDMKNSIVKRKGEKYFELNSRMLSSTTQRETIGPGTRFQVDATIADIYLVSSKNRSKIIGRPVVYAIIDVYSRLVTGINVSLEGPSWIGAMVALDNMVSDKVKYCKSYGIDIKEEEWPCHHLPQTIIADRGEFEGYNVENLVSNLGINIENTSPYRGDLKGIVERSFRSLNEKIKHKAPGAIMKEFRKRGDKDYRLDAKLTLEDFIKIYINLVIKHNTTTMAKTAIPVDSVLDNIAPTPSNIWAWGIKNIKGNLRTIDNDIMKINVMPKEQVSVTRMGIRFNGMYYSCDTAIKEQWFIRDRVKKIEIVYDPRNIDYIYIINDGGMSFEICYMLENSYKYKGLCLDEVIYIQELVNEELAENKMTDEQISTNTDYSIEQIIKHAEKSSKYDYRLSNSEKIKNIRENRITEKNENRIKESFNLLDKELNLKSDKKVKYIEKDNKFESHEIELFKIIKQIGDSKNEERK